MKGWHKVTDKKECNGSIFNDLPTKEEQPAKTPPSKPDDAPIFNESGDFIDDDWANF